jgi:AAA15 family ATPase/GTPase
VPGSPEKSPSAPCLAAVSKSLDYPRPALLHIRRAHISYSDDAGRGRTGFLANISLTLRSQVLAVPSPRWRCCRDWRARELDRWPSSIYSWYRSGLGGLENALLHPKGQLMIRSTEIQNFRGFKKVSLNGLSRVNIAVGDNGSGKTALIEALFLASASSPDIANRFRVWRGVDANTGIGTPQEVYDGIFLDLFHGFKKDEIVTIDMHGDSEDSRSVRIFYDKGEPTVLPISELAGASKTPISGYSPVTFEWRDVGGVPSSITPRLQSNGLNFGQPQTLMNDATYLGARAPLPTSQNARWFSDLSKWGREKRFVSTIRAQFPTIESINVEVDSGNPVIFIKFPWFERKIPIYLASDGLNKLVTILLHMAHSENAAVFVDEIENGFHSSRHELLWSQLFNFATEYNVQLFVTTHSWEFLKAGLPLIESHDTEFVFLQVRQDEGVGDVRVIPGKNAAAAIQSDIEIRK